MKLADKPLERKQITTQAALEALERAGRTKDADDIRTQMRFVTDFTNWTEADLLALDFEDWPALGAKFAALMAELKDKAVNPTNATSSALGAAE